MSYGPTTHLPADPEPAPLAVPYATPYFASDAAPYADQFRRRGVGILVLDFCLASLAGTLLAAVPGTILLLQPHHDSFGFEIVFLFGLVIAGVVMNVLNVPAVLAGAYLLRLYCGGAVVVRRRWITAVAGMCSPYLSMAVVFILSEYLGLGRVFHSAVIHFSSLVLCAMITPVALGFALVRPQRDALYR
jgi:hypothetical protein